MGLFITNYTRLAISIRSEVKKFDFSPFRTTNKFCKALEYQLLKGFVFGVDDVLDDVTKKSLILGACRRWWSGRVALIGLLISFFIGTKQLDN